MRTKLLAFGATCLLAPLALIASPAAADTADLGAAAAFVAAINQVRASQHLTPLTVNQQLVSVAVGWAGTMAQTGAISHNPSLAASMPDGWQRGGENVGMGATEALVENAFVNSPEHYRNMVDPAFNQIGVGVVQTSDGVLFVTEDYMEGPVPSAPSPPVPQSALRAPATAGPTNPPQGAPASTTRPSVPAPSSAAETAGTPVAPAPTNETASSPAVTAPAPTSTEPPPDPPVGPIAPPPVSPDQTRVRAVVLHAEDTAPPAHRARPTIPAVLAGTGVGLNVVTLVILAGVAASLSGRRPRWGAVRRS